MAEQVNLPQIKDAVCTYLNKNQDEKLFILTQEENAYDTEDSVNLMLDRGLSIDQPAMSQSRSLLPFLTAHY